jgi:hypothetical protein
MPQWIARIIAATVGVIVVLLVFTWLLGGFAGMTARGDVALTLGVIVAVGLGIGLMTLVFYSSRTERDEAVHHPIRDDR